MSPEAAVPAAPARTGSIVAFFGITFAVTWAAWFAAPLVDAPGAGGHSAAWTLLIYVGTFAPGITAVAMSAAEGRHVLRDLLRRLVKADAAPRLYLFAVTYLFVLKLLNAAIQRVAFGEWPVIAPEPIPLLLAATFFSTVVGGQAGEELGWRGFALPRLASRVGYAWAGLLVGVAWALWHLPLFLIPGADKTGQSFPVWALGVVALSVAMTWLWVRTGGSLLLTMLMHAAVNNLGSIVPSAVPGATDIWTFRASRGLWLTTGLLWLGAAWFLTRLARRPVNGSSGSPSVAKLAGAAAIAVAMLGAGGCRAVSTHGDQPILLVGANVLTLDSAAASPGARAILIREGRIAAIGDSTLASDPRARGARVLRFAGATLAPALVDHHAHVFNIGVTLLNDRDHGRLFLDLGDARSLADVAARVRARAATLAPGAWILGAGWSQAAWGTGALPTRDSLDAAAPNNPVYLARGDGHAGWVNARALALAGIDRNTANPPGGAIIRRADGSPSGILLERANELVAPLVPAPADSDIVAAWRLGAESLAERGVTRGYDAGVLPLPGVVALNAPFSHYYDLLRRADSVAPLPVELNLMVPAPSALADSLLADPQRGRAVSPRIHVTHLKLFADGALGSRGAALTHPYADDRATSGVPRMTTAEITALAGAALDAGLGVATHAIGDEAVRRTLDAYAEVLRARPGVAPGRLRIEHFSYVREQDFARAVKLGVVLSIQGNFNAGPTEHPTLGEARVGAANDGRVYAWRRLVGMGARLAEGSDYFTRPEGPLAGFVAAIERRHAAAEGLPSAAARRLAYRLASTWYDPSGTAEPPDLRNGESANVVVLSANPLTAPLGEVGATAVLATVCAGRLTFAR